MTNYGYDQGDLVKAQSKMSLEDPGFAEMVRSRMNAERFNMPFTIGKFPDLFFHCAGESYKPEGTDKVEACVNFARRQARKGGAIDAYSGQEGFDLAKFAARYGVTQFIFYRKSLSERVKIECYGEEKNPVSFNRGRLCRLKYYDKENPAFGGKFRMVEVAYDSQQETPSGVLLRLMYRLIVAYPTTIDAGEESELPRYLTADCEAIQAVFNPDRKVCGVFWDKFDSFHANCVGRCKYADRRTAYVCWEMSQHMSDDSRGDRVPDYLTRHLFEIHSMGVCESDFF